MLINFKSNVKIETTKVYPLKPSDRKFVNEIFDKLHEQDRMKFNNQPTLHDYSVFVI